MPHLGRNACRDVVEQETDRFTRLSKSGLLPKEVLADWSVESTKTGSVTSDDSEEFDSDLKGDYGHPKNVPSLISDESLGSRRSSKNQSNLSGTNRTIRASNKSTDKSPRLELGSVLGSDKRELCPDTQRATCSDDYYGYEEEALDPVSQRAHCNGFTTGRPAARTRRASIAGSAADNGLKGFLSQCKDYTSMFSNTEHHPIPDVPRPKHSRHPSIEFTSRKVAEAESIDYGYGVFEMNEPESFGISSPEEETSQRRGRRGSVTGTSRRRSSLSRSSIASATTEGSTSRRNSLTRTSMFAASNENSSSKRTSISRSSIASASNEGSQSRRNSLNRAPVASASNEGSTSRRSCLTRTSSASPMDTSSNSHSGRSSRREGLRPRRASISNNNNSLDGSSGHSGSRRNLRLRSNLSERSLRMKLAAEQSSSKRMIPNTEGSLRNIKASMEEESNDAASAFNESFASLSTTHENPRRVHVRRHRVAHRDARSTRLKKESEFDAFIEHRSGASVSTEQQSTQQNRAPQRMRRRCSVA